MSLQLPPASGAKHPSQHLSSRGGSVVNKQQGKPVEETYENPPLPAVKAPLSDTAKCETSPANRRSSSRPRRKAQRPSRIPRGESCMQNAGTHSSGVTKLCLPEETAPNAHMPVQSGSKRRLETDESCAATSSDTNFFFNAGTSRSSAVTECQFGQSSDLLSTLGSGNQGDGTVRDQGTIPTTLLNALKVLGKQNLPTKHACQPAPSFFNAVSAPSSSIPLPNYFAALTNAFTLPTVNTSKSGDDMPIPLPLFYAADHNPNSAYNCTLKLLSSVLAAALTATSNSGNAALSDGSMLPSNPHMNDKIFTAGTDGHPAVFQHSACTMLAGAVSPTSSSSAPSVADAEIIVDDCAETVSDEKSPSATACESNVPSSSSSSITDAEAYGGQFVSSKQNAVPVALTTTTARSRGRRNPVSIKGQWSEEEDAKLISLVGSIGTRNWSMISSFFDGRRVGKQCRERWVNHLDPSIRNTPWTLREEAVVYAGQRRYGQQWSKISAFLHGRSDNHVKNHWYCHMQKCLNAADPKFDAAYAARLEEQGELMRLDKFFKATVAPPQPHPHHPRSAVVPPIPLDLLLGDVASTAALPKAATDVTPTSVICNVVTMPAATPVQNSIVSCAKIGKSVSFTENANTSPVGLGADDHRPQQIMPEKPDSSHDLQGAAISHDDPAISHDDDECAAYEQQQQEQFSQEQDASNAAPDSSFDSDDQLSSSRNVDDKPNDAENSANGNADNDGVDENGMFLIPVRVQPSEQQQTGTLNESHRLVVMVSQQELVDILLDWANERQQQVGADIKN